MIPRAGLITGLVSYQDSLLVFKDSGVWRFTGDIEFGDSQLVQYCDIGCIAPESITVTPFGVIYLSQYGVRLTDGQDPQGVDLSSSISTVFLTPSTQNTYPNAFGAFHTRRNKYYLFLATSATVGIAPTPYILTFHTDPQGKLRGYGWSKDSWLQSQENIDNSTTLIFCLANEPGESDNGDFFAGDDDGIVWEVDVDTLMSDTNVNTTYSIYSKFQTSFIPMDNTPLMRLSRIGRIYLEYRGKQVATLEGRYDQDNSAQVLVSLGSSMSSNRFQQIFYSIVDNGTWGRYVSILVGLPANSYDSEVAKLIVDTLHRGPRARFNIVASE